MTTPDEKAKNTEMSPEEKAENRRMAKTGDPCFWGKLSRGYVDPDWWKPIDQRGPMIHVGSKLRMCP